MVLLFEDKILDLFLLQLFDFHSREVELLVELGDFFVFFCSFGVGGEVDAASGEGFLVRGGVGVVGLVEGGLAEGGAESAGGTGVVGVEMGER